MGRGLLNKARGGSKADHLMYCDSLRDLEMENDVNYFDYMAELWPFSVD